MAATRKPRPPDIDGLMQAAHGAYLAGRRDQAESCLRQVLARDPDNTAAWNNLASLLSESGLATEAEAAYRKAIAARPDVPDFHANLGNLLKAANRPMEAEESYRQAIKLRPGDPPTIAQLAQLLKENGRLVEAETLFRQSLAEDPGFAVAHNNFGILLKDAGKLPEAEAAFRRALNFKPDFAEAHNNLGILLLETERFPEAEAAFRRAVELKPDFADGHGNLGNLLRQAGKIKEAETAYRRAIELKPEDAMAHGNLGNLLLEDERFREAEAVLRRAIELKPDFSDALINLGNLFKQSQQFPEAEIAYRQALDIKPDEAGVHNNLGILLLADKRFSEAEAAFRSAIGLKPDFAEAHNNFGNLLKETGRMPEAEAAYRNALEHKPEFAEALNNLAILLSRNKRFGEAEAAFRHAVELKPDLADGYNNLGNLLKQTGHVQEAEAAYHHALGLKPGYTEARQNLGLLLLSMGRYAEAWPWHEARYFPDTRERQAMHPKLSCPQWQGESLAGKALLIVNEQGYGDNIQFARYAPLLKARGLARLTLVQPAVTAPLIETVAGVDEVITSPDAGPAHDYWCFPLSLPLHLGTTVDTIPAVLPYLHVLPDRAARWRERLPPGGRKVGLVWKGNPEHKEDIHRSLPGLATLAPLWEIPGIRFISLQKGQGEEEALRPPPGQPLFDPGPEIADFADTAAIIDQLDLVITIDSAAAHVAGALGKPVWVLLAGVGTDWRWLRDRSDSPWYPGVMRLFRQATTENWDQTLASVAAALKIWSQTEISQTSSAPVSIAVAPLSAEAAPAQALAAYQSGRLAEAESTLRKILAGNPEDAGCWNNLGNLLQETGRLDQAEAALRRAIALVPDHADFHSNLGNLLKLARRLPEAEAAYRRAIELKPDNPEARNHLGNLLRDAGKLPEAEAAYRRAIELEPDFADAHNNLGILLKDAGRLPEAEAAYRRALELKPDFAEAHNNLGILLLEDERYGAAEIPLRRAIELRPDLAGVHSNLGNLLKKTGRLEEAEAAYRRAIQHDPVDAQAYNNLGVLLHEAERHEEAEAAYRYSMALDPGFAEACNNLAILLQHIDRLPEAEAAYGRALELQPDHTEARLNLGLLLLSLGRYAEAWPWHEARYFPDTRERQAMHPKLSCPQWQGESLAGKALAVVTEQGYGDNIQFVRYAPLLKAQGLARLTLVQVPALTPLIETVAGVDEVIASLDAASVHDYWCFPLSVPLYLGTTAETIPASLPYLHVLPDRAARWRERLPPGGFKVGLVWKGNPGHKNDARRSLPGLATLAPLWEIPGISFISLQKGEGEEDALNPPPGQPLLHLGAEIADFADTAAIIDQLDLVITIDSAAAHVAGALGKPVWVLLPGVSTDWRWLRDRSDSPWYPGVMRLFRRPRLASSWKSTVSEVATALRDRAAASPYPAGGIPLPVPALADDPMSAAYAAYQAGNQAEAEALLRQILARDAGNAAAWNNLANLLHESGRNAAAEDAYRHAAAAQPDAPDFHSNLGNFLKASNRPAEAETAYRQAIERNPDHSPTLARLAQLLQETGRPTEAEDLFRQAIAHDPGHPQPLAQLAQLLKENGRLIEAESLFRQAITVGPGFGMAHNNLGILLLETGRATGAEESFRAALATDPLFPEGWNNLGNALKAQKRLAEAEAHYREGLALRPEDCQLLNNLGVVLIEDGRDTDAEESLRTAIALDPSFADCWNNLGTALQHQERYADAEAAYRRAIELNPDLAAARGNLANVLKAQNRVAEAEESYRQALALKPDDTDSLNNLAILLGETDRHQEARTMFHRALAINPNFAAAHCNLGNTLGEMGFPDEAETAYRNAIAAASDSTDAKVNLGLLLLGQGRYAEAWSWYDAGHLPDSKARRALQPPFAFPRWQGEPLTGKSLVVVNEQGHGDNVQFVRYARLLKDRGLARLSFVQPGVVIPLLATAYGIDFITPDFSSVAPHDYWCFPLSIPLHLGTTLDNLPAALPYLWALPERVENWRSRLPGSGLKVGLVWKGNPGHKNDARRSLPHLSTLAPLWDVPGVSFVSLQKGQGEEEAVDPPPGQPLLHLGSEIADFADSAAIIAQLDLLITIDSATAHVAGALGKPVWVLLPGVGTDWRWLKDRTDSPWYPGVMRLFRQPPDAASWESTIQTVAAALRDWIAVTSPQSGTPDAQSAPAPALPLPPDPLPGIPASLVSPPAPALVSAPAPAVADELMQAADVAYQAGRYDEAEPLLRRILSRDAGLVGVHWNLAVLLLAQGRWAEAWPHFDHRSEPFSARCDEKLRCPEWRGEDLAGKSLVVDACEGNGDNVMYARYIPLLKAAGASRVTLLNRAALKPLLETVAGVDAVIADPQALAAHDFWCFSFSLPIRFGTTPATIPAQIPYVSTRDTRVAYWRQRLKPVVGFRVGLVWKGDPNVDADRDRSLPHLSALAPLWDVPGVSFVSLQKGQGEEEGRSPPSGQPLLHLGDDIADFADTAAIIAELDLLISVDTAAAHVAGALGRPVWLLLPGRSEWRWLLDREDSPWYPGVMRIFRQPPQALSWDAEIREVAAALAAHMRGEAKLLPLPRADTLPPPAETTLRPPVTDSSMEPSMKRPAPRPAAFVLTSSDHGTLIVNRNDYAVQGGGAFGVGYQVLNNSSFDPAEIDLALRMLDYRRQLFGDGVVALDCGANIGIHAIEWARLMHGWGSVIAVEAQERVFYALCGNITLNNCFNARAIWGAVGAENGEIMVPRPDYLRPGSYGSLEIRQSARNEFIGQAIDYSEQAGQRTRLFTIDSLALPRVDFIKIDIEGMEMEALAGAMNTIRKFRPQMLIEKIKSDETALRNLLLAEGYRLASFGLNLVAVHASDPSHAQLLT